MARRRRQPRRSARTLPRPRLAPLRGTALAGLGEDPAAVARVLGPAPEIPARPPRRARISPWWFWIGGGVALIGVAVWQRKNITRGAQMAFDFAKSAAFKAVLAAREPSAAPYADLILKLSEEKGVAPFITVALGKTESNWGQSLWADQTGDHIGRVGDWLRKPPSVVKVVAELPKGWTKPKGSDGKELPGPYAIPADGMGWGRGIMQVDLERALAEKHNWKDPQANIRLGLTIYGEKVRELRAAPSGTWTVSDALGKRLGVAAGSYAAKAIPADLLAVAALAAYNAGSGAIRRAFSAAGAAGIDKVTYTGDYATRTTKTIVALEQEFRKTAAV